jgi:hypothetical protein
MDSFADRSPSALETGAGDDAQGKTCRGLVAFPDAKSVIGVPSPVVAAFAIGVVACFIPWALACSAKGTPYTPFQA